MYCSYYFMNYY